MLLKKSLNENISVHKKILKLKIPIERAINKIHQAISNGKKVMLCGNGGSAADAQHLAAEFLIRLRPGINREAYPVISLAQDSSTLTACGNDLGFNKIFSRTLEALGKRGDVLIAISTSGNSENVINAVKKAKLKKIYTIGLLGSSGGKVKKYLDLNIVVSSKVTARIQEAHIFLGHHIFESVENLLIRKKK
jgi:D-sedoheptulose 7-phosphate isomerase